MYDRVTKTYGTFTSNKHNKQTNVNKKSYSHKTRNIINMTILIVKGKYISDVRASGRPYKQIPTPESRLFFYIFNHRHFV